MKAEGFRSAQILLIACLALVVPFFAHGAGIDTALVTALDGTVARLAEQGAQPLQNFVKLKEGDMLSLDKGARLQLVYFDGGRQETWSGAGRLEVSKSESRPIGLAAAAVKQLPAILVKQIARTPALDVYGRGGVTRLRAIPSSEKIARVEQNYAKLRSEAAAGDLNPEFYRLSAFFEMRALDRVEQILGELQQKYPVDPQAGHLVALYQRALKDARPANAASGN